VKPNKIVERIECALWQAGHSSELFVGGKDWPDGVMAEIHRIGPLAAQPSGRAGGSVILWSWAAAAAACLAIGIGWYAFNDLNADAVLAGLLQDDPVDLTFNMLLAEM